MVVILIGILIGAFLHFLSESNLKNRSLKKLQEEQVKLKEISEQQHLRIEQLESDCNSKCSEISNHEKNAVSQNANINQLKSNIQQEKLKQRPGTSYFKNLGGRGK